VIQFNYETDFVLDYEPQYVKWINQTITSEEKELGEINYIFCDDNYLYKINIEALNHDTLTDIISFDYCVGNIVNGDIYLSIDRVRENATELNVDFGSELKRVMIHGILHYLGYKDKTDLEKELMRSKEDFYISKF